MARPENDLSTAYQAWNQHWDDPQIRGKWEEPEPAVRSIVPLLQARGANKALDVGCGIGRHALFLASEGFDVTAVDASATGLEYLREASETQGIKITTEVASFESLPFNAGTFDYILAWNVIYHGDGDVVRQTIADFARILRPNGILQITLLSKRNERYGHGREIAPNTFVIDDGEKAEFGHPHYFCDEREAIALLNGISLLDLRDREQPSPGSWHWELIAEKTS